MADILDRPPSTHRETLQIGQQENHDLTANFDSSRKIKDKDDSNVKTAKNAIVP